MIKIIIDGNFCLHKSFSTFRNFFHKGIFTGTCYGILRDILLLVERFDTNDINVCWDSRSFRKDLSSDYKETRVKDPKNNPYDSWILITFSVIYYLPIIISPSVLVLKEPTMPLGVTKN